MTIDLLALDLALDLALGLAHLNGERTKRDERVDVGQRLSQTAEILNRQSSSPACSS